MSPHLHQALLQKNAGRTSLLSSKAHAGSPSAACRQRVRAGAGRGLYGSRREAGDILLNTLSSSMSESERVCAVVDQVKALSQEMLASSDAMQLRMMMDVGMKQSRGGGPGQSASPWDRLGPQSKPSIRGSQPPSAPSPLPASAAVAATAASEPALPAWQWDDVSICVLGLGSIGKYRSQLASGRLAAECTRASARLHQLALAVTLPSIIPRKGPSTAPQRVLFSDPEFDAFDEELISALGGSISPVANAAGLTQDAIACLSPTLLYMPGCTRALNAQVAGANLQAGSLERVIILGNSWRTFVESEGLLRALSGGSGRGELLSPSLTASAAAGAGAGAASEEQEEEEADKNDPQKWVLLTELTRAGVVSELPAPDFAAHGVSMALHLFKADALRAFKSSSSSS